MLRRRRKSPSLGRIENVIGAGTRFKGHLTANAGIRIDGIVEGTLEISGDVIIGEQAQVRANVIANNVSIAGLLEGNIRAVGRVEILSTGQVIGDVTAEALVIEEGGVLRGASERASAGAETRPERLT